MGKKKLRNKSGRFSERRAIETNDTHDTQTKLLNICQLIILNEKGVQLHAKFEAYGASSCIKTSTSVRTSAPSFLTHRKSQVLSRRVHRLPVSLTALIQALKAAALPRCRLTTIALMTRRSSHVDAVYDERALAQPEMGDTQRHRSRQDLGELSEC